jgi:catechol 2,3-dioxygenase-like lactoylglutathione lyase family enzyme
MTQRNARPSVGIAHVVLQTDSMQKSADFMEVIGMRPIFRGESVSVYEMRGGTHLILMKAETVAGGSAPFDLMVDDIREAHQRFTELGLMPSPIEPRLEIDHEIFTVREPCGYIITFFSNHSSGQPV